MLKLVNRWKQGIYNSMQRQQTRAASNTLPIWQIWYSNVTKKQSTVVDKRRSEKEVKMTSVFGMKDKGKSTSRAPAVYHKKTYSVPKMDQFVTNL